MTSSNLEQARHEMNSDMNTTERLLRKAREEIDSSIDTIDYALKILAIHRSRLESSISKIEESEEEK
jgi:hypothetical protein